MLYQDGTTTPKVGDKVLGDRLKGQVVKLLQDKVVVRSRGPWNPEKPLAQVEATVDPATLVLAQRAPEAVPK